MPLLFESKLLEDYIKEKIKVSEPSVVRKQDHYESNELYVQFSSNDLISEQNPLGIESKRINMWELMAFIYSKMEFQETEAPTTLEFRIDGQAIKEMVSESHEKFLELPFESKEFQDAWKDFLNYRIEMAGSISLEKTEKILKKLGKWQERDAIKSLENSISNGWSDVYPISYPTKKNT